MATIQRLIEANEQVIADIKKLLPQLRSDPSEHKASLAELAVITSDKNVAFVVAKDDEKIIGMATLYMITKLGHRSAFIEDVVVDEGYRGQKLGEKLTQTLIDIAREEHVATIYLTSHSERIAANKLYQKLGFEQKETNVYRMKL